MPIFYLDSGSIDNLEISSSLLVSGSLVLSGSLRSQGGLTGSLLGTASYVTGSVFNSANPALSASYALSSSFALSASWAPGGSGTPAFPFTGSAQITGSLGVTGSFSTDRDATINFVTVGRGGGNLTSNTAFGSGSLASNTTGNNNTAIGRSALRSNTTGTRNTAVGYRALYTATDDLGNTAVGYVALRSNNGGLYNTAVGERAMCSNTGGDCNTAVGSCAMRDNTVGFNNTAIGSLALARNTDGRRNVAVGELAMRYNTTGCSNTAIGNLALDFNATGCANVAVGTCALFNSRFGSTSATANVAVGYRAMCTLTTGNSNVALGTNALLTNSTGVGNLAVGHRAGCLILGSNNVVIGGFTGSADVNNANNNIIIADGAGNIELFITGSTGLATFTGPVSSSGFTGSLFGTASWAQNVVGGSGQAFPFTGSAIISGSLQVTGSFRTLASGTEGGAILGNVNNYLEFFVQNRNAGTSASTDLVAYNDTGNKNQNYVDMGINSSGISPTYSFGKANDAYVYNTGGDLFIGNSTAFYQPSVTSQSLHLFTNAAGVPDVTITGSRVGIEKSSSLNATLDVNGSAIISGSFTVSGSTNIVGSGSGIFRVTGSTGGLFAVNEKTGADSRLFTVTYLGHDLLTVNDDKSTRISGSLIVTGSITGSLLGTASFATSASFASTASFALNAGGGSGFPFSGSAVITGSLTVSGSEVKELNVVGDSYFTGSLFIASNIVAAQITGSVQAVDSISARSVGGASVLGLQSAIDALSSRISAIVGPSSAQPTRYVSTANTIAAAVLTGISGLTVSVSAGVIYNIDGQIMYSVSAATGNAFGLIWPTANRVAGQWLGGISVNGTGASTFSLLAVGDFDTGDSNSAVWSAIVGVTGLHYIRVNGIIDAQTGGALYPLVRSSAAANTVVVARGSFFKLTRIN